MPLPIPITTTILIHLPQTKANLKPTLRLINLRVCPVDPTQLLCISLGQPVHGLQSQVEATWGRVHSQHVDCLIDIAIFVVELVALAAVGTVPAVDGGSASDQRESGEGVEGRVALGDEAVGAIGTGDCFEGAGAHVKLCVVGDRDGLAGFCIRVRLGGNSDGGGEGDERREDEGLHLDCKYSVCQSLKY